MQQKIDEIAEYLVQLGYSKSQISREAKIEQGNNVDFIVYKDEEPWIIIEIKTSREFSTIRDPGRLRFNPLVRQLQAYATLLKVPYYVLTDGDEFAWLTTDISGRPQLLNEPVNSPQNIQNEIISSSKENILGALKDIRALFLRQNKALDNNIFAVIVLAKFLSDQGDQQLRNALTNPGTSYNHPVLLRSLDLSMDAWDRKYIIQSLEILDRVSFHDANPQELINAIDEVFLSARRSHEIRPARWLADFLVRLGQLKKESNVLDISSGYGDILGAVLMLDRDSIPSAMIALDFNIETILWTQIQQLILGRREGRVLFIDQISINTKDLHEIIRPSHIITAPNIGLKIDASEFKSSVVSQTTYQLEDVLLEKALNWIEPGGRVILLVPENLLFDAGKRKAFRSFILARTKITAVISLASGALLPFSALKSSVLVLDKLSSQEPGEVFMSHIDVLPARDTFSSKSIPLVSQVLEEFEQWTQHKQPLRSSATWLVPLSDLNSDNLTANHYRPISSNEDDLLVPLYPMVFIKDIAQIKRGTSIRLEDSGDFVVIGPACIRPMILDIENAGRTTSEKLPKNSVSVQIDDVVLNNVGTHLGSATTINHSEGSYISQHVVLIRPNKSIILPDYLAAALNSEYVKPQIERAATGSVMPALSLKALNEIAVPLPNIDIQKIIVDRVNNNLAELEQARQKLREVEEAFTKSVKSLFTEEGK